MHSDFRDFKADIPADNTQHNIYYGHNTFSIHCKGEKVKCNKFVNLPMISLRSRMHSMPLLISSEQNSVKLGILANITPTLSRDCEYNSQKQMIYFDTFIMDRTNLFRNVLQANCTQLSGFRNNHLTTLDFLKTFKKTTTVTVKLVNYYGIDK